MVPGAQFCMHCGVAFAQAAVSQAGIPASGHRPVVAQNPKKTLWLMALLGAGVIAALAFALGLSGLLRFGASKSPAEVLRIKGEEDPGLLRVKANPNSGVTRAPAPVNTPMPADVRAWLEHLRKCEEKRVAIASDQIPKLLVTLTMVNGTGSLDGLKALLGSDPTGPDPTPPTDDVAKKADAWRLEWQQLKTLFNSLRPPKECEKIESDYDQVLAETGGMITDILDIFDKAKEHPEEAIGQLKAMQGKSSSRVDSLAKDADKKVGEICSKYKNTKWFDISGDIGGGGMTTKLGF